MDEHGLLDGPVMTVDFLVHTMLNCSGSMGCPVVVLCRCMGEGALKCSLTLSRKDLPDSPVYALGQFILGTLVVVYDACLIVFWGPCPWGCLIMS